jgi:predicted DNA-binding transcriptional regulator AlpA
MANKRSSITMTEAEITAWLESRKAMREAA